MTESRKIVYIRNPQKVSALFRWHLLIQWLYTRIKPLSYWHSAVEQYDYAMPLLMYHIYIVKSNDVGDFKKWQYKYKKTTKSFATITVGRVQVETIFGWEIKKNNAATTIPLKRRKNVVFRVGDPRINADVVLKFSLNVKSSQRAESDRVRHESVKNR